MTYIKILLSKLGVLQMFRYLNNYSPIKLFKAIFAKNAYTLYVEECKKFYKGKENKLEEFENDGIIIEKNALGFSEEQLQNIYSEFNNLDSIISFDYKIGQYVAGREAGEYIYLDKKSLEDLNLVKDFINLDIKKRMEQHFNTNFCLYHFSASLVHPNNFVEEGSFIFHRDSQPLGRFKVIVYLTDSHDEDSGPFQYLKGSHKTYNGLPQFGNSRYKNINKEQVKTCTGTIGDAVLFDNNGIHRGGRTRRGERIALTALYTASKTTTQDFYEANGFKSIGEKEWETRPS